MSKAILERRGWRKSNAVKIPSLPGPTPEEGPVRKKVKGRPPKKRACTWCRESKSLLPYVFPCPEGKKEFCSESCLTEFSKTSRTRKILDESGAHEEGLKTVQGTEKAPKKEGTGSNIGISKINSSKNVGEESSNKALDSQNVNSAISISICADNSSSNSNGKDESRCLVETTTPINTIVKKAISSIKVSPVSTELEAATSTTQTLTELAADPNQWSIENVIHYISCTDQYLEIYADLFRKHEIDGKAFLLLNFDMMMKYMGLKLGPAVKICNIINKLNRGRRYQ